MSKLTSRQISERDIAIGLVLELADFGERRHFSLLCYYDDDSDFFHGLANRLNVVANNAFHNKLTKVVRNLVNVGVLETGVFCTHKEYVGEPTKQTEYWLKPGAANRLTRGRTECTNEPEWEASFLIRRAYENPNYV